MASTSTTSVQAQIAQYAAEIQTAQATLQQLQSQAGQLESQIQGQMNQIATLQSELAGRQKTTSPPPTTSSPYPYAFLVADRADYSLVANAGVPRGAIFYAGADPLASQAGHGSGYSPASFLPPYTGATGQPSQTVVVGVAGRVRQGTADTLMGATRVQTQQLLSQFLSQHPAAFG